MSWKIKYDEETNAPIITDDGKITYIDPEGKELPLNPPEMYGKIISLGKENQKHREKFESVAQQLKVFEGVEEVPNPHISQVHMIWNPDLIDTPLQWGAAGVRARRTVSTVLTPRLKPLKRLNLPSHNYTPLKWGVTEKETTNPCCTCEISRLRVSASEKMSV